MVNFSDTLSVTFDAGVGLIDVPTETTNPTEGLLGSVRMSARLRVQVADPAVPPPIPRLLGSYSLTPEEPAYLGGRPVLPVYAGRVQAQGQLLKGVGHIRTFDDPDPVWNGSSWDIPPPPSPVGSTFVRWTARSLPDPAGFTGGTYPLGLLDSGDGTSGYPSGAGRWRSADGSDYTIDFNAVYPFKPTVAAHVHYGTDGSKVVHSRAVFFAHADVSHMFADMGTILDPPFTVLVAGVVTGFPGPLRRCTVFDAGADPRLGVTTAQRNAWLADGFVGEVRLSESYGYRTALAVQPSIMYGWNDPTYAGRLLRLSYNNSRRPQVFALVVNGSQSQLHEFYPTTRRGGAHRMKTASLANHGAQRFLVMGRANSVLSSSWSSSMALFEIRMWDKALTSAQLQGQYNQLSSTWKFGEYR